MDPDNIKGRGTWSKGRLDKNRNSWEDPTNLVQSVSMRFLRVQRTFSVYSMLLLGGLGHAPKEKFEN